MKQASRKLRLGINIDHVATLRNVRGGRHPDPVRAALLAMASGADGITAHLREDRRHIRDEDMHRIMEAVDLPLNFEMASTKEMQKLALKLKPHACCLVPEKRAEKTTEGGLDVAGQEAALKKFIAPLKKAKIRVSLFIDPDEKQVEAAARCGAPVVEIHTGHYAETGGTTQQKELARIRRAVSKAVKLGLEVHAGHGLNFANVGAIAAIPQIRELNIGHFLVGEAIYSGLGLAIDRMRDLMDEARRKEAA